MASSLTPIRNFLILDHTQIDRRSIRVLIEVSILPWTRSLGSLVSDTEKPFVAEGARTIDR